MAHAELFAGGEPFLVHAGDTLVTPSDCYTRLLEAFEEGGAAARLLVEEVEDPRMCGVVVPASELGGVFRVKRILEKPREPPSRLAVVPVYVFEPVIFDALRSVTPGPRGEVELTDAIEVLIDWGYEVRAVMLREGEYRIDVGTPETYWEALRLSYGKPLSSLRDHPPLRDL